MKARKILATFALWMIAPLLVAFMGYFFVLPRLQRDHEAAKMADAERVASMDEASKRKFTAPVVKVNDIREGARLPDQIKVNTSTASSAPRRRKRKPKTETPAADANAARPAPRAAPEAPSSPPPAASGNGETVPVPEPDGGNTPQ
jgi:hypothetical protein